VQGTLTLSVADDGLGIDFGRRAKRAFPSSARCTIIRYTAC